MIAVGLLSGTSLDGIDAVRVALRPRGGGYRVDTQAFATIPFEPALRTRILRASPPARVNARTVSRLHAEIGEAFGRAALVVGAQQADFVASHGVTLAHDGDARHSLQIGDAFRIREATGRSVVYDFRSADAAAGGHGAPLVPYVDALLLADPDELRVALNLGGIANLTVLPPGAAPAEAIAFDSGPANLPIDTYVALSTNGAEAYDRAGAIAAAGRVDETLLVLLAGDPYFARRPPKTTGRERFGGAFVTRYRRVLDALTLHDAVATLTALSVRTVAAAIVSWAPGVARVIVSGGGVHNRSLLEGLRAALPALSVELSGAYGIDVDATEAIAFAILGYEALRGRPAGLPAVTGARGARVLGALASVAGLLGRVRAEDPAG